MAERPSVAVAINGLSYWPRRGPSFWTARRSDSRPILSDNKALILPGCLTGIFGPSGGGKTTLLNAIAARISNGNLQGSVSYVTVDRGTKQPVPCNGQSLPVVSYVMAKERFLPGLTIEETVQFSAQLKLPHLSAVERAARVSSVLEQVGLTEIKDAQIKKAASAVVGLAELKRISLGVELLGDPSVIILDEPTSGLTTAMSAMIIRLLQRLAKDEGRTILCSIHQPRSSVFNLFDRVMLLNDGCVVYHGPPHQMSSYLSAELGVKCPPRWNVADFALEVVTNSSASPQHSTQTITSITDISQSRPIPSATGQPPANPSSVKYGISDGSPITEDSQSVKAAVIPVEKLDPSSPSPAAFATSSLVQAYEQSSLGQTTAQELQEFLQVANQGGQFKPFSPPPLTIGRWFSQCWILTKRQFRSQSRDVVAFWLILLISLLQGLFIGAVFWQLPQFVDNMHPIQLADVTEMLIPYEAEWFTTLLDGVDGNGFQPIFNMIDFGDDGRGRSVVDSFVRDADTMAFLGDWVLYVYDRLDIVNKGYPSLEWLDEIINSQANTDEPGGVSSSPQASEALEIVGQALNGGAKMVEGKEESPAWPSMNDFPSGKSEGPQSPMEHPIRRFLSELETAAKGSLDTLGRPGIFNQWMGQPQIKQMLRFVDAVNARRPLKGSREDSGPRDLEFHKPAESDANILTPFGLSGVSPLAVESPTAKALSDNQFQSSVPSGLADFASAWLSGELPEPLLLTALVEFAVTEDDLRGVAETTKFLFQVFHLIDWIYYSYDWASLAFCDTLVEDPANATLAETCWYYECALRNSLDLTTPVVEFLEWPELTPLAELFSALCGMFPAGGSVSDSSTPNLSSQLTALAAASQFGLPHVSSHALRRLYHVGQQYNIDGVAIARSLSQLLSDATATLSAQRELPEGAGGSVGSFRVSPQPMEATNSESTNSESTEELATTGTEFPEGDSQPPSWIASFRLNEAATRQYLERYRLTGLVTDILGNDLFRFFDPLNEVFDFVANDCRHPICTAGMDLLTYVEPAVNLSIDFVGFAYETLGTMFNISGVLFFVSLFLGFTAYDVLLTFQQQRTLFNKETANGLYCPSAYYVAKTIADLPYQFIPTFVLGTTLFFMVGLHRVGDVPVEQYFVYLALCFLVTFSAYGFGYMISAWSPRVEVAVLVAPVFVIIWLCIAGFFLREGDLRGWISWFRYVSFYRWAFCGHVANMFRKGAVFGSIPNELNLVFSGIAETRIWLSCLMLFVLAIVYRLVGFVGLKFSNRSIGLEG